MNTHALTLLMMQSIDLIAEMLTYTMRNFINSWRGQRIYLSYARKFETAVILDVVN